MNVNSSPLSHRSLNSTASSFTKGGIFESMIREELETDLSSTAASVRTDASPYPTAPREFILHAQIEARRSNDHAAEKAVGAVMLMYVFLNSDCPETETQERIGFLMDMLSLGVRNYYRARVQSGMSEEQMRINVRPSLMVFVLQFWITNPRLAPIDFSPTPDLKRHIHNETLGMRIPERVITLRVGALISILYLLALRTTHDDVFVPYTLLNDVEGRFSDDDYIVRNVGKIDNGARESFESFMDMYGQMDNGEMQNTWRSLFMNDPTECAQAFLNFALMLKIPIGKDPGILFHTLHNKSNKDTSDRNP
jgi:hypothetical protein